jgi:hypothetical protein
MADIQITPNQNDIANLKGMFDRLRNEGKKSFVNAIAWASWYVGKSIGAQTKKERAKIRKSRTTTASDEGIIKLAQKTNISPKQAAGWWRNAVTRLSREGDGTPYEIFVHREQDLAKAKTIKNQGFSKKSWVLMANVARKKSSKVGKLTSTIWHGNPLEPGTTFSNRIAWMPLIVGNLSGIYASAERNVAHHFEREAAKAAKTAGA